MSDLESAMSQAKEGVLFGQGRRHIDNLDPEQIELERTGPRG